MTPERWKQLSSIYHAAMACSERERSALLAELCGSDDALRRDVESMLAPPATAAGLLSNPPFGGPTTMGNVDEGALADRCLGVFQLYEQIGIGGMGEVYRARDTRLGREVAIKILPSASVLIPTAWHDSSARPG